MVNQLAVFLVYFLYPSGLLVLKPSRKHPPAGDLPDGLGAGSKAATGCQARERHGFF